MANHYLKAQRIAAASLGLLEREIILPGLVWRNAYGDYAGAAGDTITVRVPARTTARTRTLRGARPSASEGDGIIQMDELQETSVDVTLDTDVYSAVPVTVEELTLDISDFGAQVLAPQVRAVAEGIENAVAAEMTGATYATTITLDTNEPYNSVVDARVALNKANVPMTDRFIVCGADMEGIFLKSDHLRDVDTSGTSTMLREATIGKIAGFNAVVVSNALPSNVGFAFHRTAYVLGMRAPGVPDGASFGASRSFGDLAMRWLRDYDFRNVQDRSLVDCYLGTNITADGPSTSEIQTLTVTGGPTGGTFVVNFDGQTTAAIAWNASALTVQNAIGALSRVGSSSVSVSGSNGGPWTVTFKGALAGKNVAAMTTTSSLTGGSSPAVTVATTTGGVQPTFVRAVKFTTS